MEDVAVRFLDSGKIRRAERTLKQMLEINPDCLAAHFHLARVYRKTKQYELGLHHARRVLRLNPKERNACLNLGLIYELMGKEKLATVYYKKELSQNPGSSETLWNFGRLAFRKKRWRQASLYLRRCFDYGFLFDIDETVQKLGFCYYKLQDLAAYIALY